MTPKKQKALSALLLSPTVAAAAERAGIGYASLRRWLAEDPEFRQAYQDALAGLLEDAAAQAKQSLSPALSTLREISEDPSFPAAVRVQASRALLDAALKLTEITDVISRIEAIERSMKE